MLENNIWYILILILLILFINLFIILRTTFKKKEKVDKDQFTIYTFILNQVIEDYKKLVFSNNLNELQKKHNTNPKSETNAIKLFLKKKNNLLESSTKDILKSLNKDTYLNLLKFYSENNLILYIINILKG